MLLPDVNVLLAASRDDHAHHEPAIACLEDARGNGEPLGLSDYALASVIRLATGPHIFARPTPVVTILEFIDALLDPPGRVIRTGSTHWHRFRTLCVDLRLTGNHIPDAYLAAVALEQAATLVSFDRGFHRYPGLSCQILLDR